MRKLSNIILGFILFIILGLAGNLSLIPLWAADNNQSSADLQKQIQALSNRLDQLEKNTQTNAVPNNLPTKEYDPFEEMNRMRNEMNAMFQNSFSRFGSAGPGVLNGNVSYSENLNLEETKDGYVVKLDTAGLDESKIDIQAQGHTLTVSGQNSGKQEVKNPNAYMQSSNYGSFSQMISLPKDADTSKMETKKEGNILMIRIPKGKSV